MLQTSEVKSHTQNEDIITRLVCLNYGLYLIGSFPVGTSGKETCLPTQETWDAFRSLGWEDPSEEGMTTHSRILAWRNLMDRGAWRSNSPQGRKEPDVTEVT